MMTNLGDILIESYIYPFLHVVLSVTASTACIVCMEIKKMVQITGNLVISVSYFDIATSKVVQNLLRNYSFLLTMRAFNYCLFS